MSAPHTTSRRAILSALFSLLPFPAFARRRYRRPHHKRSQVEPINDQPHTVRSFDVWQNQDGSLRLQPSVDLYDVVPPFSERKK